MLLFSQQNQKNIQKPTPKTIVSKATMILDCFSDLNFNQFKYYALCLHTSKLRNQNDASLARRALVETLLKVMKKTDGKLFGLPSGDEIIIFKEQSLDEIKSTLLKLSFLFSDEPILQNIIDIKNSDFITPFMLPTDNESFKAFVNQSVNDTSLKSENFTNPALLNTGLGTGKPAIKKFKKSLSPEILTKLQTALNTTDFSGLIRRQSVCAIIGKSTPQVLFDEVFVSIPDMRDTFLPDVDLITNPWLFQALTETLDKGVLNNLLRREDSFLTSNFSLNLNVETILSETFLTFDNTINPQMKSSIVLEVQIVDVFSDIRAYNLAKTLVQSRGYKICIDGITTDKIKYINQAAFEADFIKVIWSPDIKDALKDDEYFSSYENKAQRAKYIICRVDDETAINVGNELGINLYQGRYIQKLLAAQVKRPFLI